MLRYVDDFASENSNFVVAISGSRAYTFRTQGSWIPSELTKGK
jgi:hypothetical protein